MGILCRNMIDIEEEEEEDLTPYSSIASDASKTLIPKCSQGQ
jgi:hypothetical protein